MSMQQIEIERTTGRMEQDNRNSSTGNKGVTIMSTITRTAHGTQFGIGMIAVMAAAVVAFLSISAWPVNSPTTLEAPATESRRFSPLPAGLTDYQGLQTERARPNFSALPQGLTDYQNVFTERAAHTPLPQGLTDYVALQPKARVNHSPLPQGLTDYQALVPNARVNLSSLPQGLTDYAGLRTVAPAQPNFSPLPAGLTDYQAVQTVSPRSNFSPLPAGLTDYQGLGN